MSADAAETVRRTAHEASRAMGWGVALKTLRFGFAIITAVVIRRVLGPELVGQYGIAQLALEIAASVASMGMGQAVLRFLPEARLGTSRGAIRRLLGWAFGLQFVGWAVALAAVLAWRPAITSWLKGETTYEIVVVGLCLLGVRLLFDLATQVYYAIFDLRPLSVVTLIWQVIFLGATVLLLEAGWGVVGVLVAGAAANLLSFLFLLRGVRARLSPRGAGRPPELGRGRILRYGLPFALITILYNVVWRHSESFFINYHWGPVYAGHFFVAYGFPQQVLEFVPAAIWPLIMASYAAMFTVDRDRARRLVTEYYKLLFLIVAPLSVGGIVLGDRALLVLYGEAYRPGAALCQIFFLVQCASFLGTPLSMTLYVLEKTWLNLCVWAAAAIVNVGLVLVLVPIDWRLGSTVPVALAVVLMPATLWLLLRREGYRVQLPWAFLGRAYLGSSPLLLVIPLRSWVRGPLQLVAAAVLAGALVVVGMRIVRVLRRDDRALIDYIPSPVLRRGAAWFGERA